jgi:hypothetical protein
MTRKRSLRSNVCKMQLCIWREMGTQGEKSADEERVGKDLEVVRLVSPASSQRDVVCNGESWNTLLFRRSRRRSFP